MSGIIESVHSRPTRQKARFGIIESEKVQNVDGDFKIVLEFVAQF